jgi:hypothetical protein
MMLCSLPKRLPNIFDGCTSHLGKSAAMRDIISHASVNAQGHTSNKRLILQSKQDKTAMNLR